MNPRRSQTRRRYLISYDISGDKRRTEVFKTLRDHGDHLQYSVFLCELSARELAALRSDLDTAIHHREDQVILIDLGPPERSTSAVIDCLGRAYAPPAKTHIV